MGSELAQLIRGLAPAILDSWAARNGSAAAAHGASDEDIRTGCRHVLESTLTVLEGGTPEARRAAGPDGDADRHEHGQADAVFMLLQGRQSVLEALRDHLPVEDLPSAALAFDKALASVLATYCPTPCLICGADGDGAAVGFERLLGTVVEQCLDAIVLFEQVPDRTIRDWNAGAEALFGWTHDEIVGKSLNLLLPDDCRAKDEIDQVAVDLASKGHARLPETIRRRKDRGAVWVDVSYTCVFAPDETTLGIWAIYRDITERRQIEEQLQEERFALIGNLAARLAHEIRNPLSSILLNLDLVRDYIDEERRTGVRRFEERLEILGATQSQVRRIHRVVEDYLGFARLTDLRLEPIDLDELVRRNVTPILAELADRRIRLVLALDAAVAQVGADESQLWQAIVRLIRNAIEAMPRGGTLTITTRAADGRVLCEIRDTGVGMTPETQAMIFRPFFSTKPGGTGLGIALAQQVARAHGATLECRSIPREGTVITVSFPALDGVARHAS